jgi:hypothetical protein
MAAIIRGRRDALAKLELEFTVGQSPFAPHPDIESRWADLMAHMWLSEEERLSYIRDLRERKKARQLEHKAKRGDSAASAQVEAKKEREQAALKAAQAKAQASIDESLRNLRRRLYAYDVKGEGYVECAPARNACRGEGLSVSIDGDARDRCLIKDVVKTAERAARRREQPREVECVKNTTEPLPSIADLRKAFYDADVDGTGVLPADRVQRRWRDLCGNAADPAVIQKASNARGQITLSTLEEAIAARGRRPRASAASRSVTSALVNSARRPTTKVVDSSEASSSAPPDVVVAEPVPRRREIIVVRDEERDAEAARLRLLGDDAPAEPPAMPDAPAFCTLRGAERDCRFFTTGVISNTSSGFVDLTSERRDDEDAFFDLRLGVAFGDNEPADATLTCTLRYRGAARDLCVPVLGGDGGPCRAPVIRIARAAAPLKIAVFGRDGAPLATAALDLSALTGEKLQRVVLRAAPARRGARPLGVVFEAEAIHNTQ